MILSLQLPVTLYCKGLLTDVAAGQAFYVAGFFLYSGQRFAGDRNATCIISNGQQQ
jgi:hypothetical protein